MNITLAPNSIPVPAANPAGAQAVLKNNSAKNNSANNDPATNAAKNQKAARDFEAMLLTPVLDALQKTFAGDSEDSKTPGASDYRALATQALAQAIAARGGIGIGDLILRHLSPPKVSGGS
jgi:Rod binding domain-containing protein